MGSALALTIVARPPVISGGITSAGCQVSAAGAQDSPRQSQPAGDNAKVMRRRDRRSSLWIRVAHGTCACLAVSALIGLAPKALASQPQVPPETRTSRCDALVSRVERFDARVDEGLTTLTWRGSSIPLTPSGLSRVRPGTSQEALWLHSLAWLVPSAARDPAGVARIVTTHSGALPDPGPQASREVSRNAGWSEGQIRRRLETMECLFRLTGRAEFGRVGRTLGSALMDDRRYYGLPLRQPHNHGAQANRLLLRTGELFDQPEWITTSRDRILRDRESVFSACGMSNEQSTSYQWLNVGIWDGLARAAQVPADPRARLAAEALVRPDGVAEPVGDGRVRTGKTGGGSLWCPDDGWAAATEQGTHHTLRFGPRVTRHGHDDHGSLTWFTHGRSVLADRSTAPKSDADAIAWSRSRAAHSTLERVGDASGGSMSARRLGDGAYDLAAEQSAHRRTVQITRDLVDVTDVDEASSTQMWIQHWHFAEGWTPERGAHGLATGDLLQSDGSRVRLICRESGRPVAPVAVRVRSYAGGSPAWAWDMQCRHRGTDVAFASEVRWLGGAGTADTSR